MDKIILKYISYFTDWFCCHDLYVMIISATVLEIVQ